jgi:hypothetical protein
LDKNITAYNRLIDISKKILLENSDINGKGTDSDGLLRTKYPKDRVHSFGHFEKLALLKARTFSLLLKSVRFEKRELLKSAR